MSDNVIQLPIPARLRDRAAHRRGVLVGLADQMLDVDVRPSESVWALAQAIAHDAEHTQTSHERAEVMRVHVAELRRTGAIMASIEALAASGLGWALASHITRNAAQDFIEDLVPPPEGIVRAAIYRGLERHRPGMSQTERAAIAAKVARAFAEAWPR